VGAYLGIRYIAYASTPAVTGSSADEPPSMTTDLVEAHPAAAEHPGLVLGHSTDGCTSSIFSGA